MSGRVCVIARPDSTPEGYRRVYVGRPTALGNPYPLRRESERAEVIERYGEWLTIQLSEPQSAAARMFAGLQNALRAGEHLALECWCAPRACHADVLARRLELGRGGQG